MAIQHSHAPVKVKTYCQLVGVTFFVYSVFAMSLLSIVPCGTLGLANLGTEFVDVAAFGLSEECAPTKIGYDGQLYWGIALDPISYISNPADPTLGVKLDLPSLRIQRIGLPLIASTLGWGNPLQTSTAILIIELISVCIIVVAGANLANRFSASPWLGLLFAFFPGFAISVSRLLTEPLAIAGVLAGLVFLLDKRWFAMAVAFSLAVLTRETTVLFVGVLWLHTLFSSEYSSGEKRQAIAGLSVAVTLFICWQIYIVTATGLLPTEQSASVNLSFPGTGLVQAIDSLWPPNDLSSLFFVFFQVYSLLIVVALIYVNVVSRNPGSLGSSRLAFFGYCTLIVFFSSYHLDNSSNLLRSLTECILMGTIGGLPWLSQRRVFLLLYCSALLGGWILIGSGEIFMHVRRFGLS